MKNMTKYDESLRKES